MANISGQRRVLIIVLAINAVMFVVELTGGIRSGSSALIADSVDMFGDASVYGLSLFALERSIRWRAGAALAKGGIIFVFGIWVVFDIVQRLTGGGTPSAAGMGLFGALALAANLSSLGLLWRFRNHGINMASTFECSRNDVMANTSVLVAAGAVSLTGSGWPDLVAAALIAVVFMRSSFTIVRAALPLWLQRDETPAAGPGSTDMQEPAPQQR